MVSIQRSVLSASPSSTPSWSLYRYLLRFVYTGLAIIVIWLYGSSLDDHDEHLITANRELIASSSSSSNVDGDKQKKKKIQTATREEVVVSGDIFSQYCPVSSISSLSPEEIRPKAHNTKDGSPSSRYVVDPPSGGKLTLVCCSTTKGNFSALLHHRWAPKGVERLLSMIKSKYFDSEEEGGSPVPLFRCTDACQLGLSSNPNMTKRFDTRIDDDPLWLPTGPTNRVNEHGVKRYPGGIWTFAGSGPNSRTNQMVITLKANQFMGGGSPWEVPLGEFVGAQSFDVLSKWYTGYHEKGPSQKILRQQGVSSFVKQQWPLMDSILSCQIIDEDELILVDG
mmetsp:Transcript_50114/g.121421  ORF Transcript_50114/g.121421 Transcript_50114/m.121421 type:complete len:338 (-) Transcript_50114:166-1179(-)